MRVIQVLLQTLHKMTNSVCSTRIFDVFKIWIWKSNSDAGIELEEVR